MGTPIDHQLPCWGHAFMAPAVWIQLDAQLSSYPPSRLARERLGSFVPQNVSNSVWALATLGFIDPRS